MENFAPYVPTFARYGLLIVSTKLTSGGWLPPAISDQLATDPALIELTTGLVLGLGTLIWFGISKAKTAIRQFVA